MNRKLKKLLFNSSILFLFVSIYSCKKNDNSHRKGYIKYQMNGNENKFTKKLNVNLNSTNGLGFYAAPSSDISELSYTEIAPFILIRNLSVGKKYLLTKNNLLDGFSDLTIFSGDQPYCDYALINPNTDNNYFIIDKEEKDFKCIEGRFSGDYYLKGNYFNDAQLPDTIRIRNGEFNVY